MSSWSINDKTMEKLKKSFEKYKLSAKNYITDEDKLEKLLQAAEERLKTIPKVGDELAYLPMMISLVRRYALKEYTGVPLGSVIAVIAALIYLLNPLDLIPDFLPMAGQVDDAAVILLCYRQIKNDLDAYDNWRKTNGKKKTEF